MEAKRRIFLISTLIFFIIGAIIILAPNNKKINADEAEETLLNSPIDVSTEYSYSRTPASMGSSHDIKPPVRAEDYCQDLRVKIPPLEELKKTQMVSERFINVHKIVNGSVFRLRFFYKEHAEGETPMYLVYIEDPDEVAHLMENSSYQKGPEYLRIEKAAGEILHTEKGINVGEEDLLFLHYVNSEIKGFQGIIPELDSKAFIDCRF